LEQKLKKVLIITYYWPPTGSGGVYRWLKFAKYLREFGWEPVIYTPLNPEQPEVDNSLLKDIPDNLTVIKRTIVEPYSLYRFLTRKGKKDSNYNFVKTDNKKGNSIIEKFTVWLRGNLFIPDARCFWIRPSVRFLSKYLQDNPVDAIVSTGPPHSMHMIGLGLQKRLHIPWLADFRDPWTDIDFYHKLMLTKWADTKHHRLERLVFKNATLVVTVSQDWANNMLKAGANRVEVVHNGYDHEDFNFLPIKRDEESFIISYFGSLNKDRNPEILWNVLYDLSEDNKDFRKSLQLHFYGTVDIALKDSLMAYDLLGRTTFFEYVEHEEALKKSAQSSVLLLLLNNTPNVMGIIPGKMYEYMAAQRPILCIGPTDNDAAHIINDIGAGKVVDYNDFEGMKAVVLKLYASCKQDEIKTDTAKLMNYSRKILSSKISKLLNGISI